MNQSAAAPAQIRHYRQLAKTLAQNYFGREPSRIVYKSSGLTNFVFAINHVEGQYVIRLSPEAERLDAFRKEFWATRKAREMGVPTPAVLVVGSEAVDTPYMISRRVSGSEATHHPRRRRIIREMGSYAAVINSIRTNNFGKNFDWQDEKQKNPMSWPEYLEQEWLVEDRFQVLERQQMLPASQLQGLRKIIEEAKQLPAQPSLNHGDLRLKNIIVDEDGEITAIIDWEECLSTIAPQWDLSIGLHDLSIDEKHLFIQGYGLSNKEIEEIAPFMKALNILNYSTSVEQAVENQDHKALEEFKLRLHGWLDLFSL